MGELIAVEGHPSDPRDQITQSLDLQRLDAVAWQGLGIRVPDAVPGRPAGLKSLRWHGPRSVGVCRIGVTTAASKPDADV
jgi:hypothetical protein